MIRAAVSSGLVMILCSGHADAASLARMLRTIQAQQIQAHRHARKVEARIDRIYRKLVQMVATGRRRHAATRLLVALVEEASTPGPARLYPRLTPKNHNRHQAVTRRNLRRLLVLAAGMARGSRPQREVARRMVEVARPQEYGALVALLRAQRRLGQHEAARTTGVRAILSFPPAETLVLESELPEPGLSPRQIAEISLVLWAVRDQRTGWHAFQELRRADTFYYGRSAAPRLQAIAYLASRARRGRGALTLLREIKRWEAGAHQALTPGPSDQWVRARPWARRSGWGLGHLDEVPVRLARKH